MGALISLPVSLLNLLLPFTRPETPLLQDLIHTAVLCGSLYYAPQIAEWYDARRTEGPQEGNTIDRESAPGPEEEPGISDGDREREGLPLDERLVLQDDGTDEDGGIPPPLAPTPPNIQNAQEPPLPQALHEEFAQPGPANPGPRPTAANRTVGAKKAKSLARKDQRRAYHEFHRQEAELRRLRDAEGAEERDAVLQAERERRAKIEAEIAEKEREERNKRKEEEKREAAAEVERRDRVIQKVKGEVQSKGFVDLLEEARKEGKDKTWALKLIKASGLISQLSTEGAKAMITGDCWLVKIDAEIMRHAYAEVEKYGGRNGGRVGVDDLGGHVERAVRARIKA